MVFGEVGNFSAYGFAPASLVAPLGTTTVIGKVFWTLYFVEIAYQNALCLCCHREIKHFSWI